MLTILTIISLLTFIILSIFNLKSKEYNCYTQNICDATLIFFVACFTCFILLLPLIPNQNAEIIRLQKEKEITIEANNKSVSLVIPVLEKYGNYEKETLNNLKPENIIATVNLYPELKNDQFVSKQAEIIQENINKEKEISLKQIQLEKEIEIRKFVFLF